jgi:hypothetical protein
LFPANRESSAAVDAVLRELCTTALTAVPPRARVMPFIANEPR